MPNINHLYRHSLLEAAKRDNSSQGLFFHGSAASIIIVCYPGFILSWMLFQIVPHISNREHIEELLHSITIENIICLCVCGPAWPVPLNIRQQLKE